MVRTLAAFDKKESSSPSTHIGHLQTTGTGTTGSKGSDAPYWPLQARTLLYMYWPTDAHGHIVKKI